MKKGIALSVFIVGIFLLSLSFTSALEFDNVKTYDPITREVTIINSFGLGSEIGKARLNTPLNVKIDDPGYQKVAEFDMSAFTDYNDALKSIKFYNKNYQDWEKHEKLIDYDLKYKYYKDTKVNDYQIVCSYNSKIQNETCERVVVGTHIEQEEKWEDLTPVDLMKNDVLTIGIFTNVKRGDVVEWIPRIYGVDVEEWASWNASLIVENDDDFERASLGANWSINSGSPDIYNSEWFRMDTIDDDAQSTAIVENGTATNFKFKMKRVSGGGSTYLWLWNTGGGTAVFYWEFKSTGALDVIGSGTTTLTASYGTDFYLIEARNIDWSAHTFDAWLDGVEIATGLGFLNNHNSFDAVRIGAHTSANTAYVDHIYSEVGIISPDSYPTITFNSPAEQNFTTQQSLTFNFTAYDDINLSDVKFYVNGALNQTNASGTNNSDYLFDLTIGDGTWEIYGKATDNESQETNTATRTFIVDTIKPQITDLAINASGTLYGYPQTFAIENNETDDHLQSCWYNLNYNLTNISFTCDSNITLNLVPEGNRTITIFANDSFGWENSSNLDFEVDYYTHNITYVDNKTGIILTPTCNFSSETQNSYDYHYDIHNTTERIVNCSLFGYDSFNHTLTESNKTSYNVSVQPAELWLIFDDYTNAKISWLGGGLDYENVSYIKVPMRNISLGKIHVEFNNQTQLYSFNNDNNTFIKEYLHLETPDLDQQVKVLSSSNEIANAWVIFKKIDNSSEQITYSAFTDVNGVAHILVDDGTSYDLYVYKDGYEDYSELVYIPHSNTETLIVNLISEDENAGDYLFQPSCGNYVGIPRNCSFYVKSYKDTTIHFNYTWNGNDYYVVHEGSEATLTLLVNSTTIPINVTVSVNPTKTYSILWEGIGDKSIQLEFDEDEIKDAGNEILGLFYLIVIIIGLIIAVSINRIPATKGFGAIGFLVWIGIIAVKFPLLWFIAIPGALYYIFKALWGEND